MLFKEHGNKDNPTFILLHGGGLSWWSLEGITDDLKKQFHVVTPIIDGHGEDGDTTFISIENSAKKLISYIDVNFQGKIYALGGLSIGAQIVCEVLAVRNNITEYAIIESALVYPIKTVTALVLPTFKMFYGLVKKRWFSRMQARTLFVPNEMFERYYEDSLKISKESLINITISNGNYNLKETIADTKAKVLIIVGGKEIRIMKKSANILKEKIKDSQLYVSRGMGHGEISLVYNEEYLKLIKSFVE